MGLRLLTSSAQDGLYRDRFAGAQHRDLDFLSRLFTAQGGDEIFQILHFDFGKLDNNVSFSETGDGCRTALLDPGKAYAVFGLTEVGNGTEIGSISFSVFFRSRGEGKADKMKRGLF